MAVYIIGAGFAGSEAAWQLAMHGIKVKLVDMKPAEFSPAHHDSRFCELVCSNSFKAQDTESASGLLKEEMRRLGSVVLKCADANSVPAGGALAVDRVKFSQSVTDMLTSLENISIVSERIDSVRSITERDDCEAVIIATGPLTHENLSNDIIESFGDRNLHFYDAAAPLVFADSIDRSKSFKAARYGKGDADYINCPMNRSEYDAFYEALLTAECASVKDFDESCVYEGCMPVEVIARRGSDTLRFGPLKPVGLNNPETGEKYYAVVQLRQDNTEGTLYNIVGFQTRLKFGEQKRVFGMIPALSNAEYARYGVMHRNTYIHSPGLLDANYRVLDEFNNFGKPVYFGGQITGVEGYIESAASGLTAALGVWAELTGHDRLILPKETVIGGLASYASNYGGGDFQPMGASFGIVSYVLPPEEGRFHDKRRKKQLISQSALSILDATIKYRGDYFYGTEC